MDIGFQYVMQCRTNDFKGITPANVKKYDTPEYHIIVRLSKQYMEEEGLAEFSLNFQGDQYFVELWTAHMIFEYGNPDMDLKTRCLNIIKEYSTSRLTPIVAMEETEWLKSNNLI